MTNFLNNFYNEKTLLFTFLIYGLSFGQTTVFQENFEGAASYTTSMPEQNDGGFDYFTVTDGTDLSGVYNGPEGSNFFAAHDLDADGMSSPATMTFDDIDISTFTDLTFLILLAEDDDGSNQDWDNSDFLHIEYDIDNSGSFTNLLWIENDGATFNTEPQVDLDFDGNGDGASVTDTFTEFTAAISGSGSVIDIRITFGGLTSSDEDIALDDIRIIDGFVAMPSITITAPTNGSEFDPGTTSVDLTWSTANLSGSETVDVTIESTTINYPANQPSVSIPTLDGSVVNVTVDLVDGGILDSDTTTFSVKQINTVATIGELRMGSVGDFYTLTGEGILTFQQDSRYQKVIEDDPGNSSSQGIVIDDADNIIKTTYNLGDGISGITGRLSDFGGTLQFVPSSDPGAATSSSNALTPQSITLSELDMNSENYESELVKVTAVTMDNSTSIFNSGSTHGLTQGGDTFNFRSSYPNVDYVVQSGEVPVDPTDITGIVSERFGPYYLTARDTNDFSVTIVLSTDMVEKNSFAVFPNPTNLGYVNIFNRNNLNMQVSVFDILGKQILNKTISNNKLNVSNLKSGVYIIKISQDEVSTTKKLVVQ